MKIKRFFAPDMRQAIRMVREEQGPDAVILSNRRVDGGVEIVAALDYDPALVNQALGEPSSPASTAPKPAAPPRAGGSQPAQQEVVSAEVPTPDQGPHTPASDTGRERLVWAQDPAIVAMREEIRELRGLLEHELAHLAWGDLQRRQPNRVELLRRLNALGVKPGFAQALAAGLNPSAALEQAWEQALQGFARAIPTAPEDMINEGGMVALVGSTGVGKTTTVAKLAARYALRHGARKVALVTTDSYRIGAHEQLLTYGRILGVPVQVATDHAELQRSLRSLMDKHLVLIDTAGMSQRDMRLSEQFATLRQTGMPIRCCLVVSATAQGSIQEETIKAFRGIDLDGCILTKVDETASLGSALSVISEQQLPLAYVCDGQRVPEDLQPVRPLDLVRRAAELSGRDEWTPADAVLAERFGGAAAHAHV